MQVELDPKLHIAILEPSSFDALELIGIIKNLGFQKVVHEKRSKTLFEDYAKEPPGILILVAHRDTTLAIDLLRDLKSSQNHLNFPIIPVLKPDQQEPFMAIAQKYGVQESIHYPVHPQTLMGALARAVNRFDVSSEEKGLSDAKLAFKKRSLPEAISAFEAVRNNTKSIRTELGLGQAWLSTNEKEKSAEFLQGAATFDAENFQVRMAELEILVAQNVEIGIVLQKIEQMAAQLETAYRIPHLIRVFLRQKNFQAGLLVLDKFGEHWLELERQSTRFLWARLHYAVDHPNEALALLLKSVKDKEANADAYNLLGVISSQRQDLKLAKNYYLEALRLSPGDYRLIFNIALICEREGNLEDAQKYFKACLSVAPSFDKAAQHLEAIKSTVGGAK